jgi:integrase
MNGVWSEWPGEWPDHGLVFTREDGQPHHPDRVSKLLDRAVTAAKLPRIRSHDPRHSHATHLFKAGVHPTVVQERLGHAKVSITMDVCVHLLPNMQEDAVAANAAAILATRQGERRVSIRRQNGGRMAAGRRRRLDGVCENVAICSDV